MNTTLYFNNFFCKQKNVTLVVILSIIFTLIQVSGCSSQQKEMRAYIDNNVNWRNIENCGYQGCDPLVDFLTSKDLIVRVELDKEKKYFIVRLNFESIKHYSLELNSNEIELKIPEGGTLKPKFFSCSHTYWDLNYLRLSPQLKNSIIVKENDCLLMFFDYDPININNSSLNLKNGFSSRGVVIDFPVIHFRQNISTMSAN